MPGANGGTTADGGAAVASANGDDKDAAGRAGAPSGHVAGAPDGEAVPAAPGGDQDIVEEDMPGPEDEAGDDVPNPGLKKALETYRNLHYSESMTTEELERLDEELQAIRDRPVVETDVPHEPVEIEPDEEGAIMVGPPTLTRFEKARIMGARALQLSEGAPAFIEIPESAMTSLDIAMVELEQRVIPITIRRVLPNGDFQNVPIDYFKA